MKARHIIAFRKIVDTEDEQNNGNDEKLRALLEAQGWDCFYDRYKFHLLTTLGDKIADKIAELRRMFLDEVLKDEEEHAKPSLFYLKKAAEEAGK